MERASGCRSTGRRRRTTAGCCFPETPNPTSSPFRVHAPGPPSSSVCIRLPAPAGSTRLALRKSRNWRRGIGPTGVAPPAAIDVGWPRSELAMPCMLRSTVDPPRWFFACTHSTTASVEVFFAASLESWPKHLGFNRERRQGGQHRDHTEYPSHTRSRLFA
jgi:hypothetical protein